MRLELHTPVQLKSEYPPPGFRLSYKSTSDDLWLWCGTFDRISINQVWYQIRWIEYDTQRYWSSYEFWQKIVQGECRAHFIKTNIFVYHTKESIQSYHYYVMRIWLKVREVNKIEKKKCPPSKLFLFIYLPGFDKMYTFLSVLYVALFVFIFVMNSLFEPM